MEPSAGNGLQQRLARRIEMEAAGRIDPQGIARAQRADIVEMFEDRALIAGAGEGLVPLVVIVEDEGDDVVEIDDKTIAGHLVDQKMEFLVER